MMALPKFDERTGMEVAQQVYALLHMNRMRAKDLHGRLDVALVKVFSRFSELVIDRLNRAPEKKFLAFLDLLGVSPLPMEAAMVPLTFSMAPNAAAFAVVHAGTQVAAAPPKGSQKPPIYETISELVVTDTRLDALFINNGQGAFGDLCAALLPNPGSPRQTPFALPARAIQAAFTSIPRLLCIAIPANPAWQGINRLCLHFTLDTSGPLPATEQALQWEIGDGVSRLDTEPERSQLIVHPDSDTTGSLTRSGVTTFTSLPPIPLSTIDGLQSHWLWCRAVVPINGEADFELPPPSAIPVIREVTAEVEHGRSSLPVEQAFYEKLALDVSKDFFPFGPSPRLGDTLYFSHHVAFSEQGAAIRIAVELANPNAPGPDLGIPRTKTNNTLLCWEFWDGESWCALNIAGRRLRLGGDDSAPADSASTSNFSDDTQSLSVNGVVSFSFPRIPAQLNLNGVKNYWIRVRIAAGDYGREVRVQSDEATGAVSVIPATLAPPCIHSLKIDYSVTKSVQPSIILVNDWEVAKVSPAAPFRPFVSPASHRAIPSLYLGFNAPRPQPSRPGQGVAISGEKAEPAFPHFPVNAYVVSDEAAATRSEDGDRAAAGWEYWTGSRWKKLTVADKTQNLSQSGLLQFLLPQDFVPKSEFGRRRHWLRMRLNKNEIPPIRSLLLNTTLAIEGSAVTNEILGSSTGEPKQRFRTNYPSVLRGQTLEVCEPTSPPLVELELLDRSADPSSLVHITKTATGKTAYWVLWREVDSFYASGPRDRHYILDHITGEVLFGNGVSGMIPPILDGNIRVTRYRTGGGRIGNQPAQAVKQLVTAVPYVQQVVNWVPACGGSDAEPVDAVQERGPRELRHGGRAVTREDFEDLAIRSSREVARARCVPQCNLASDPNARYRRPGLVSVVVVPRLHDPKPVPSMDLLDQVRRFLGARHLATAELVVVGPEYVQVDVEAEIAVESAEEAAHVEQTVTAILKAYLHPLTGGPAGSGWDFGHVPQRSDLYVLIEGIPGVGYIRDLKLKIVAERPGADQTRHFLVCCGDLAITTVL
jgi:hypothetical protein